MTELASRAQLRASFLRWALFLMPLVLLLGYLSLEVSGRPAANPWYVSLDKPLFTPDPLVFQAAWAGLYVLLGLAAALVCGAWGARGRTLAIVFFVIQLALSLAWPPLFFRLHEIEFALYLLGGLDAVLLLTLGLFWRVRWLAGFLLLPCLAAFGFATFLNWQVLELNREAGAYDSTGPVQRVQL